MDGTTDLPEALRVVEQTKQMIREVETLLPASANGNFRERLVALIESGTANKELQEKADMLFRMYKDIFGVKDLINSIEENKT